MSNQAEITWKMRSTLVNWIVEVHWKYKLLSETLFLAINILDRYTPMLQVIISLFPFLSFYFYLSNLCYNRFPKISSNWLELHLYSLPPNLKKFILLLLMTFCMYVMMGKLFSFSFLLLFTLKKQTNEKSTK